MNGNLFNTVSLNAKSAKLVPLELFKLKQIRKEMIENHKRELRLQKEAEKNELENKNADKELDLEHVEEEEEEEETFEEYEENVCYYDVKIRNELNEDLDYKIVKGQEAATSTSALSMLKAHLATANESTANNDRTPVHSKQATTDANSLSSSSSKITSSSSVSSLSSDSVISIDSNGQTIKTEAKVTSVANSSSLKVEYVPRGKIITINVSIMW